MDGYSVILLAEPPNTSCSNVKEEPDCESHVFMREHYGAPVVKEELNINDTNSNEYILDATFDYETVKAEPTLLIMCNEVDEPSDDIPLTLRLVNKEGNSLDQYIEKNDKSVAVYSAGKSVHKKLRDRKTQLVKNNLQKENVKKISKGVRLKMDEVLKHASYLCKLCNNKFLGRKIFRLHLLQHITTKNNFYCCYACNYVTVSRGHMNRHIMQTHCLFENSIVCDERFYTCNVCSKKFFHNKDLLRHMYVHSGNGPLKCNVCDFSHTHRSMLEKHKLSHASALPLERSRKEIHVPNFSLDKFECHYCGYKCDSKSQVSRHVARHLGEHRFKCDNCDYTCLFKGDLMKHYTIHSADRAFVCVVCSKTFKRRSHLVSHTRCKSGCQLELKRVGKKESLNKKISNIW